MKPILYLFLIIILLSCKTKQVIQYPNEMTYDVFTSQQKSFKTDNGTIKYIDKGKGEVILLLHGVPTSGWLYRHMIDDFVRLGYRVIVPDMLGFGASDSPKAYDIYMPIAHGKRLIDLMDYLNIEHWTQVSHDVGGLCTWEVFDQAPNRISKLVILNSIIYEDGFHPPIRQKKGVMTKFGTSLYKNKLTNKMVMNGLFRNTLKTNNLSKIGVEGYRKPLLDGKTNSLYAFFSTTCNDLPDYSETLKKTNIPTMVIWGKYDKMLRWKPMSEQVMSDLKIKPEDVHIIDAKHFIQEEKPKEIVGFINRFIKKNK
jgi:pimeloyl-ACP methyl ester carboxylesterase